MEITKQMLSTIYERANQFSIAKYGKAPDSINIQADGTIEINWTTYHCGESDTDYEYVNAEDLTADLSIVAAERRKQEEEARQKQLAYEAEQKRKREERETEERRRKYLELKKEFEK